VVGVVAMLVVVEVGGGGGGSYTDVGGGRGRGGVARRGKRIGREAKRPLEQPRDSCCGEA